MGIDDAAGSAWALDRPRGTVLVVDDDGAARRLLELALTGQGFSVLVAGDGVEGLEACETVFPVAVLTDLEMPRMDGLALCGVLRERVEFDTLPILLLTASDLPRERALRLQRFLHIEVVRKPCDLAELAALVRQRVDASAV